MLLYSDLSGDDKFFIDMMVEEDGFSREEALSLLEDLYLMEQDGEYPLGEPLEVA